MYSPPTFMTVDLFSEVVAEFEWPAPYQVLEDLPFGIAMVFDGCTLYFSEGFESEMRIQFLPRETGLDRTVTLTHALVAKRFAGEVLPPVTLIDEDSPWATESKVRNGIRDLCTLVLAHLRSTLLGDFGWVEAYRRFVASTEG